MPRAADRTAVFLGLEEERQGPAAHDPGTLVCAWTQSGTRLFPDGRCKSYSPQQITTNC